MAYVSGLPSYVRNANGYELKGAVDTRQASLQQFRKPLAEETGKPPEPHPQSLSDQEKATRRSAGGGDRRKVCQRFLHLPVLVELRSGVNRRCRNLREGDIVEHVSVEA